MKDPYAFHHAGRGVAQEFTSRLECTVYPYVVLGDHEEVAGFWRMVRCLFGDVVASCIIRIVPVASERLAQDRVQWLFDAPVHPSVTICRSIG